MIYLDNNATTQPAPPVVEAMTRCLADAWANPSSPHTPGRHARQTLEDARQSVADLLGAKPRDVVFTAGGTESIHLAIRGTIALAPATKRAIVISAVEHEAIVELTDFLERDPLRQWEIRRIPVGADGLIDEAALEAALTPDVALASIQWANNETGIVQPVERIGALCRDRGITFHCDATQWVGKMPTNVEGAPIDLLTTSAHKLHGPKGIGALWVRRGVRLQPILHGVQERETRGGTENTPGIVGFGVAADLAREWLSDPSARDTAAHRRDALEDALAERVGAVPNTPRTTPPSRLWNTASVSIPGVPGKSLVARLSDEGVCVSTGAACATGIDAPPRILEAMGVPRDRSISSVRISLSRFSTDDEISLAIDAIARATPSIRAVPG